jgi:hypothetical protein
MNISNQLGSNIEVDKYLPQTFFHATTRKGNALGIHENWFNNNMVNQSGATFFAKDPEFSNMFIGFVYDNIEKDSMYIQALMEGKAQPIQPVNIEKGKFFNPYRDNYLKNIYNGKTQPAMFPVNIEKGKYFDPYNDDHLKDIYNELPKFIKSDDNIHDWKTVSSVIEKLKDKYEESWRILENEDVSRAIRNAGYDGFYVREAGFENLAIFNPKKAKSIFETGIGVAIEATTSSASKVQRTGIGNSISKFANMMKDTLRNLG